MGTLFDVLLGVLFNVLYAMTYDSRRGAVTVVYRPALIGSMETYLESAGQRNPTNTRTYMQKRQTNGLSDVIKATLTFGLRFYRFGAVHDHNL